MNLSLSSDRKAFLAALCADTMLRLQPHAPSCVPFQTICVLAAYATCPLDEDVDHDLARWKRWFMRPVHQLWCVLCLYTLVLNGLLALVRGAPWMGWYFVFQCAATGLHLFAGVGLYVGLCLGDSWRQFPLLLTVSAFASGQYFLMTNFGVWLSDAMYPHTWSGLIACYAAGIPFLTWSCLSDAVFMCTGYALIHYRVPSRKREWLEMGDVMIE